MRSAMKLLRCCETNNNSSLFIRQCRYASKKKTLPTPPRGYSRNLVKSVVIPHSIDIVHEVVSNVGDYSKFLPFCVESSILRESVEQHQDGVASLDCVLGFRHLNVEEKIQHRVSPWGLIGPREGSKLYFIIYIYIYISSGAV